MQITNKQKIIGILLLLIIVIILLFGIFKIIGGNVGVVKNTNKNVEKLEDEKQIEEAKKEIKKRIPELTGFSLEMQGIIKEDNGKEWIVEKISRNERMIETIEDTKKLKELEDKGTEEKEIKYLKEKIKQNKKELIENEGFKEDELEEILKIEDIQKKIENYNIITQNYIFETGEVVTKEYKQEYEMIKQELMLYPGMEEYGPPPAEEVKRIIEERRKMNEINNM